MPNRPRLSQRWVRFLIAAALIAVGALALFLNVTAQGSDPVAFGGEPLPALYADSRLPYVKSLLSPQVVRAERKLPAYIHDHPVADDRAFIGWALATVGPPPRGAAQRRELAVLHRIDAHRTPAGIKAANWLEAHGKKDVWKLFRNQYRDLVSQPEGDAAKAVFKKTYKLANEVVTVGKPQFGRPSPYITDPSLHALNQARFATEKKVSYPSKHAVIAAALTVVLAHYEPHRVAEYRSMEEEIDFSRLYAGGHYPSDLAASAYLGTLVANYELAHQPTP